jgi:UV excision repair protein RAD23
MKLILKNLKQVEFEIQIESNSITVKDLKNEIEKIYSFDSDQIKILFSGIILEDQKVLSEYNIIENSTIIIMNLKPKKNSNTENKTSNVNENKDITQNKMQVQNNPKQDITEILKDNLKIQVDSLVDMGFERSQVEIAVKAANGRIDLAIDYLNNGIPDKNRNRNRNNNQRNNNNSQNEIMKELKKQAGIIKVLCKDNKYMIFTILNNIKRNDPGLLRLITDYRDEFEKLLDAPITEEDERYYKSIETKADEIIHKRLEEKSKKIQELANKNKENQNGPNKEENKEESDNKKNEENKDVSNKPEEKEKSDTNINKEEENKENKENMEIEEEKKSDKKENQNENIDKKDKDEEKVNENIENKENTNIDLNNNNSNNNNPIQNQLTEEDNQVIERLKNLGDFSREKVIEAYIVCNKNEELTANYLFEQYN